MAAKFKIGDLVAIRGTSYAPACRVSEVSQVRQNSAHDDFESIYRIDGWIGWVNEAAITNEPKTTHRIILEIEDPSALKVLTGATIVSDTLL